MTIYPPDLSTPGLIKLKMIDPDDQIFYIHYEGSLLEASYEVMPQTEPEDRPHSAAGGLCTALS